MATKITDRLSATVSVEPIRPNKKKVGELATLVVAIPSLQQIVAIAKPLPLTALSFLPPKRLHKRSAVLDLLRNAMKV